MYPKLILPTWNQEIFQQEHAIPHRLYNQHWIQQWRLSSRCRRCAFPLALFYCFRQLWVGRWYNYNTSTRNGFYDEFVVSFTSIHLTFHGHDKLDLWHDKNGQAGGRGGWLFLPCNTLFHDKDGRCSHSIALVSRRWRWWRRQESTGTIHLCIHSCISCLESQQRHNRVILYHLSFSTKENSVFDWFFFSPAQRRIIPELVPFDFNSGTFGCSRRSWIQKRKQKTTKNVKSLGDNNNNKIKRNFFLPRRLCCFVLVSCFLFCFSVWRLSRFVICINGIAW